jgi:hypothetical protein
LAFQDWGTPPINSTGVAIVATTDTTTLVAELDSTRLGTAFFATGQQRCFRVTYILGSDTNTTWQVGVCNSTALNSGQDEFFPKTGPFLSPQYVVVHTLVKDQRIRVRTAAASTNASGYISAEPLT